MLVFQFLKSKTFFIQIAIAIAALLLFVFGLKFWLGVTTNHDQRIQVPNLQKLSMEEVDKKLTELDLAYKVTDGVNYNPSYPKKSVIEQNPKAGNFVKEKRKIYLTLNPSKYRDVSVPDLNGRTKRQASSQLRAMGLHVGTDFTFVTDIGKDVVRGIRFEGRIINEGDQVPLNSIVNLVLGDGEGR
jgi:beta-lactam-binding protein with PASTA domain